MRSFANPHRLELRRGDSEVAEHPARKRGTPLHHHPPRWSVRSWGEGATRGYPVGPARRGVSPFHQPIGSSSHHPLDSPNETVVTATRRESLSSPLLTRVVGAAHGRPEAVHKYAAGTRTFDRGAVEVVGQAEGTMPQPALIPAYWNNIGTNTRKVPACLRRLL